MLTQLQNHLDFVMCSTATCTHVAHLPCLAKHFTHSKMTTPAPAPAPHTRSALPVSLASTCSLALLPTSGACPGCGETVHWQDLIRGSYRSWEECGGGAKVKKSRVVVPKVAKEKEKVKGKGKKVPDPVEEASDESASDEERSWAFGEAAEGSFQLDDAHIAAESDSDGLGVYPATQSIAASLPPSPVKARRRKSPSPPLAIVPKPKAARIGAKPLTASFPASKPGAPAAAKAPRTASPSPRKTKRKEVPVYIVLSDSD